ncbi:MAG: hypothetical protein R3D88_05485 [Alphaproteobacteria bacterium]|nr:hypothetical protein [Alphaproteobacteria bacterium]
MPRNKKYSEQGNVFIIILVAVALFGLLLFTFSRTGSQGSGNLSKQQAKIAAQEMLNYARLLESAVNRVRSNGCSESEINFDNTTVAGYTNVSAPVDNSCDIFSESGGRVEFSSLSNLTTNGSDWLFSPSIAVVNIGTDSAANVCNQNSCTELIMFLGPLDSTLCSAINTLVNAPIATPETMTGYGALFTGAYTNTDQLGDATTTYRGISTACIDGNSSPAGLYFYHVLLAR